MVRLHNNYVIYARIHYSTPQIAQWRSQDISMGGGGGDKAQNGGRVGRFFKSVYQNGIFAQFDIGYIGRVEKLCILAL